MAKLRLSCKLEMSFTRHYTSVSKPLSRLSNIRRNSVLGLLHRVVVGDAADHINQEHRTFVEGTMTLAKLPHYTNSYPESGRNQPSPQLQY
jgi:hypothetical protein